VSGARPDPERDAADRDDLAEADDQVVDQDAHFIGDREFRRN
jgi:hypothetical protein